MGRPRQKLGVPRNGFLRQTFFDTPTVWLGTRPLYMGRDHPMVPPWGETSICCKRPAGDRSGSGGRETRRRGCGAKKSLCPAFGKCWERLLLGGGKDTPEPRGCVTPRGL